jgi:hypothetical protein
LTTIVASPEGTGGWTVVACTMVASTGRTGGCTLVGWTAGWTVVACAGWAAPILVASSIVAGPEEPVKSVALPS